MLRKLHTASSTPALTIRAGFTLVEILVTISIISMLASIILTNVNSAREKARIAAGKQFYSSLDHALGASAIGSWSFSPTGGATAYDSAYGNNGALMGDAVQLSESNCSGLGLGGCLQLDSSWKRVLASAVPVSSATLTLSAWINPTAYPSERSTIIWGGGPPSYYLSLASDGSIQTYWYYTTPEGYHSTGAGTAPLNIWTYAVGTWDGAQMKIYVNGVLRTTVNVTGSGRSPSIVNIGAEFAERQFYGLIDEVRIFSESLTAQQIQQMYAEGTAKHRVAEKPLLPK